MGAIPVSSVGGALKCAIGSAGPQKRTPAAIVVVRAIVNHENVDISGLASSPPILTFPNFEKAAAIATRTVPTAIILNIQPTLAIIQLFTLLIRFKNVSLLTRLTITIKSSNMNGGKNVIFRSCIVLFLFFSMKRSSSISLSIRQDFVIFRMTVNQNRIKISFFADPVQINILV